RGVLCAGKLGLAFVEAEDFTLDFADRGRHRSVVRGNQLPLLWRAGRRRNGERSRHFTRHGPERGRIALGRHGQAQATYAVVVAVVRIEPEAEPRAILEGKRLRQFGDEEVRLAKLWPDRPAGSRVVIDRVLSAIVLLLPI